MTESAGTQRATPAPRRLMVVQAGLGAGGAERVIALLAAHRLALGTEMHIVAFVDPGTASYFPLSDKIVLHLLGAAADGRGGLAGAMRTAQRVWRLRKTIREVRPDLVLSFLTKINILTLLAAWGTGLPVVVSERNNPERQGGNRLWHVMGQLLQGRATALVMQTEAIRRRLPGALRARAVVIPNPVLIDATRGPTTRHGDVRQIVAVGRLVAQKGFDLLIRAFAAIADRHPEWQLTVFGDGPGRASLTAQIAAAGLADRIHLPGVTATPGAWVGVADVFVLSSRFEGFPNVLVEAMAAGLPVVSTACPYGPADLVTDGVDGLLVPSEDADALSNALARLMADPSLRARLSSAAIAAASRFAAAEVMQQWDALLASAASAGMSGRSAARKTT